MLKSTRLLKLPALVAGLLLFAFSAGLSAAAGQQRVTFHNSILPIPAPIAATERPVLAAHEAETMEFGVAMQMRDFEGMQERIARGEIISREELERAYLPLQSDYDAVVIWLASQGFVITKNDASRLVVYARGTLAQVRAGLQVRLVTVTANDGQPCHAADTAPSLPLNIATRVLGINHLQPFHQHLKHSVRLPLTNNAPPFKISEILAAYNAANLGVTGANQKIAILIDTVASNSDLTAFWSANGIAQSLSNIETVNVNGGTLPAPSGEETLDEEWASGIAPGAKIRVYASRTLSDTNLDLCLQRLINDLPTQPQIHQLSISLGLGETYVSPAQFNTDQQLFATIASSGVSIFVSSGDGGSTPDGSGGSTGPLQVEHYASDPSVTAVGGTSLYVNSGTGLRSSESTWSGSGGGVSIQFNRPSWQTGAGVPSGTKRCVPDVCLAADPNTGAYVYLNGGVHQYGGTSWSAPAWAGFCALINEARANAGRPPLGLLNPSLYPLIGTNNFVDVTSGSNATSTSGGKYSATTGYDQATGIGAPHMANLMATLVAQLPPPPTIASFTPSSGVQNTTVTLTGTNFYSVSAVSFNGTSAGFSVNSPTRITASSPAGAISGPLSVTTSSGTAASAASFTVISGPPAPSVAGFSPAYGPPGTSVILSGTNLSGATAVKFNGVNAAAYTVNSSTQITATVAAAATTGPISVTTPSGTAASSSSFTVLTGNGSPTVASFTPNIGLANTSVTITGTNFVNVSSITFGGAAAASPVVNSATQITATVPAAAVTGPIVVTTGLGSGSSASSFTIGAAPAVLASWDVSGLSAFGASPLAAVADTNVTVGGLTRSSGVTTNPTAAFRAWGGNGFDASSAAAAVTAGDFATFTLTPNPGFTVSLTSISKFDYRRSSQGPPNGVLQYQINSGAFSDIATLSYSSSSSSGASLGPFDLSATNALQNIAPGAAVTFRIVSYGGSSGGNWYIFDKDNSTAADLALTGIVNAVAPVGTPDVAIAITHTGNFAQSDTGKNYTLTVSNTGTAATSGAITVTDTLPSGLTATAISGAGWTTNLGALTATRSDALAANSSYPPLTVTVDVSATAPASLTHTASVSGGGETNTANNSASDSSTILPTAAKVGVETDASGGGNLVVAQNLGTGSAITVYAITRTASDAFMANAAATWSLTSLSGEAAAGDLIAAGDGKSAVFTAHGIGSAVIQADIPGLAPTASGAIGCVFPFVNPQEASNITLSSATLNGSFNPNGVGTTVYFEYGADASYGQTTGLLDIGNGSEAVPFHVDLSGLQSGATTHFRLVLSTPGVITRYADQTFTTSTPVPAMPGWACAPLAALMALLGLAAIARRPMRSREQAAPAALRC